MTRRFARYAVGALSLSLLLTMAVTGTAQAAPGVAKMTVNPAGAVWHNDTVNLVVDFPTGKYDEGTYGNYPYLSVFSSADGTTFNKVAKGVKSDKAGKLTLTYDVGTAKSWVKVCNDKTMPNGQAGKLFNDGVTELCTSTVEFDPKELPPATAELVVSANGKTATATFGGGALKNGQAATLEIETIVTTMTAEVGVSTWKTIATGKQNASGQVTFTISDPYEVSHNYRAKSGKFTTNVVTLDQAALSASMGKKETGIPQVYFNTNEQTKVNTRTKWSEGRFTMVQAGKNVQFAECNDPIKKHKDKKGVATTEVVDTVSAPLVAALKGRGNYSWSFPKKSFSLKLDSKHDICGMGQHKKWALVANHYDKSLLRNTVARSVGQ
ncbi:MAG: CotH kinase family protein [Acidobacteriota bacterium]|nr:CotH kinase family protein [Acidobacteriota bacterium]